MRHSHPILKRQRAQRTTARLRTPRQLRVGRTLLTLNCRVRGDRWRQSQHFEEPADGSLSRPSDAAAIRRLEAVLFLAQTPLTSRKLARLCGLADGTRARTLLRRLNEIYDQSGYAFRAENLACGIQLLTRPRFALWLQKGGLRVTAPRLSSPAMETLAVVAYLQPVLRADVEAIRGVQCGELLKQLMSRDLVRISGRSEELGRPYLYSTTKTFLAQFGLKNLDDLPAAGHPRKATSSDILTPAVGENEDSQEVRNAGMSTASLIAAESSDSQAQTPR